MYRRGVLLTASAGATGVAGCSRRSGGEAGSDPEGGSGRRSGAETSDGGTLDTHPAATDLDAQPAHGNPVEAPGVVVAFEDPFCPLCGRFESNTVPKIRSELVEPGDAAFVFRGYPVTYPDRSRPATRALEATYARDEDAHWALADHYFSNQGLAADAVLPEARSFLDGNTDVDGAAVVSAVESGAADAAVETDRAAGEAAGASATPSVFLFRDGQYRTKFTGSVGFESVRSALGF